MTKLPLIVISVLVTICSAHAQVGWTLQQCKDKYGIQPIRDADKPTDYDFTLPQYKVTVTLDDKGVVTAVVFSPLQVTGRLDLALLDSTEIKSWQGPPMKGGLVWKRFKELEMAPPNHDYKVWIAFKKGKPVIDLTLYNTNNGDIQSVWLEATSASQLAERIEDAKTDGKPAYQGP
jgi:hypothetical protein